MNAAGTLESLIEVVAETVAPLGRWLAQAEVDDFFAELGLRFIPSVTTQPNVLAALQAASAGATDLSASADSLSAAIASGDSETMIADGATAVEKLIAFLQLLDKVGQELNSNAGAFPTIPAADVSVFAASLQSALFDAAAIAALESGASGVLNTLAIIGLVDRHIDPGTPGDPTKPTYEVRRLRLDRIAPLLQSPSSYFQSIYGWGSPAFDGQLLFNQLLELAGYVGLPAVLVPAGGGQPATLDLFGADLQIDSTTSPPSLKADLILPLTQNFNSVSALTPTNWTMTVQVTGNFVAGLAASISPPAKILLSTPSGTLTGQAEALFALEAAGANNPIILIGQTGGSALQATSVTFGAGITVTSDSGLGSATAEPLIQFAVTGGLLIIDMSEADGFLQDVTGGTPIQANFGFAGTWAPDTGLHITGGAQLEIQLPLHLDLGPVTIETIYVVGGIATAGLTLELSAAMGVTLGPIQASVDRVGLTGTLNFPQSGGNLGPANLKLGFKPPNGLGIDIDAGPVAGGGYISFDPSQGQYAGVLSVSLADIVQVTVIGVIDTIMPDGSSGFSFILIITFNLPPIQLGFGFTLNGVGGLGGVNRSIDTTALQAGFVAHSLNSILFPPDPVANAPAIISNIRSFFPVAEGEYVFGPMLEVGWGTPSLITLEIGVILQLPDPVIIVLLGLVQVALPDSDAALIELNIAILGELDFGTDTLDIEGDLYDSYVLIYSMSGSLYFRICWGSEPNFVYAVGGFNPNFNTAGLDLPPLQRCTVSIGFGGNPCISASNYFAVTSNSLQFGANVQAYASAAGFTIKGYLGFDVLIIFSPFSFIFDFAAGFSISFEGFNLLSLTVSGSFSGPRPWNLNGSASISVLWWTISASLNLTWGDSTPVTIPQAPVLPDLVKAIQATGNWSAALPPGMTPSVSLTAPKPGNPTLLVYPMGTLTVRENVVPLDTTITLYGNATPSDGNIFAISDVQINGAEVECPAQFVPVEVRQTGTRGAEDGARQEA